MSHTKGKCEVVHTNWRTSLLVFGGRIMAECNVDPDFDEDNASDVEAEDAEMEKAANAERIAALWNAAEELELTTEKIAEGVIQMTFAHNHERSATIEALLSRFQQCMSEKIEAQRAAGRLKDQYENVSKHYSRRGEDIERLEAEKAEMLAILEELRESSTCCGTYDLLDETTWASPDLADRIEAAIRKARGGE